MKKKIRLFGDTECHECMRSRNLLELDDVIKKDDNIEVEIIITDEETGKIEWEKIQKRTGVYFLPHYEIKWEDGDELHLSMVRDFQTPEHGYEKLKEVLSENYKTKSHEVDYIELREKVKSLISIQEILFEKMENSKENFTNIRDFINIPGNRIKL